LWCKLFVTTEHQNLLNFISNARTTAVRKVFHEWIEVHLQMLHYAEIKKHVNPATNAKEIN